MATKRKVGGYEWNHLMARAKIAADQARRAMERISSENPGPQTTAMLMLRVGMNLAEIIQVLTEMDGIGRSSTSE